MTPPNVPVHIVLTLLSLWLRRRGPRPPIVL